MDINNGFKIQFGYLSNIPNNGWKDATFPITFETICQCSATHAWFSGDCAFNHVITVGSNLSIIRLSNRRIINNDGSTISGFWIAIGF